MAANVLEGAEELLVDAVTALDEVAVRDYIVIGGWCPYLRNTSSIPHPGTLDVDILFRDGSRPGALATAISGLRHKGFILSAKHSFQLLSEKVIKGERLIYNVDLLHPLMSDSEKDRGMVVDHLELDVPLDHEERFLKKARSIVQPNSSVLFDEHLFSKFTVKSATFDLVDFTGMFITKMDSCQKQKRERDALDLYIAVKCNQIDFQIMNRLRVENPRIKKSFDRLLNYLRDSREVFDNNVAEFAVLTESPATALEAVIVEHI
jgi:hypothetical protein